VQRETLTIAGFALDGTKWDGLYVGRRKGDDLVYAGKVDHGFDKGSTADLQKRVKPLIRTTQPYAKRICQKASGLNPNFWLRLSTAQSPPREKSGTRSSAACGKTCDGCIRSL
jgi:ATP-dependent DNA ligase